MSAIEKRARELLAAQYERIGNLNAASDARRGLYQPELAAIAAALTPPEGFVLVPVEPTVEMMEAAGKVVFQEAGQQWADASGFAEGFVIETQRLCHAAMLAARPEVP